MIQGFYAMSFAGGAGSGVGVLAVYGGAVVGADQGGATYDGTYCESASTGTINVHITMRGPVGMRPVQTGIPLSAPLELPFTITLAQHFGSEKPFLLNTPLGPVNIVFKKIRDFPA